MKKTTLSLGIIFYCGQLLFAQEEPVKFEGFAQGTTYHITYFDKQNRDFQPEVEKILSDFDKSVSTYLPSSIISRINRGEKNVVLDKYFITCFNKAKDVWKNTDGAFYPTVYPIVNLWGWGPGKKQKVEKKIVDSILQFVGFEKIELKGNKVVKKDPRVGLDFNAFAQGYSVDVVSEFLNSKGISQYIVEIGGEVYAKGKQPNGDYWTVGIEKPIDNKDSLNPLRAIVNLENMAVSTSGNNRRYTIIDGVKYAHHIDPKTGYPTNNNLLSASVFAKDCITTDANATGLLVMGLEKSKKFLELHKELQAFLIYSDEKGNLKVYQTSGLEKILSDAEE